MSYSKERANNGVCGCCGDTPISGKRYCVKCAERLKAERAKLRQQRRSAGLCKCGKIPPEGLVNCRACITASRNNTLKLRARRQEGKTCVDCNNHPPVNGLQRCSSCLERDRISSKVLREKLTKEVYEAYGGARCNCCGESFAVFLAVDHVGGWGSKHRKEIGGSSRLKPWIKRNNFPPGFQILCHNL